MSKQAALALAALAGVGVWAYQRREMLNTWFAGAVSGESGTGEGVAGVIGGFMKVANETVGGLALKLDRSFNIVATSNMRKLVPDIERVRSHQNVVAFLHVIRHKEHYASVAHTAAVYGVMCGGGKFTSFADHPRPNLKSPCGKGAAGAYQITIETWDWIRGVVGERNLPDFSPVNQERCAVYMLAWLGALQKIIDGKAVTVATSKNVRGVWTSLPGANEDRGYTTQEVRRVFGLYGGLITE